MKPIKLGIIGCGIAARDMHWPALKKMPDKFTITLVCNHTAPKAESFARMVGGVPYVLDYHEMLQHPEVEAVDIILPIHLNYQVTKDALNAGKHVIVEKPLAANLDEAKKMVGLEQQYSVRMMVAENFRYRPTLHRVQEIIEQHHCGKPYAVFWNVFYKVDQNNKYAQTQWRLQHQYPGGFVTDGGVHNIAALRMLFGEIIAGSAFTKSINRTIGELDTFSFQFLTTGQIHGVLNIFFSAYGYSENRIIVLGEDGSIIVEGNKITIKKAGQQDQIEEMADDGGYVGEFVDFFQAIRSGKKVKSSFQEAFHDLRIIINALQAAQQGLSSIT